MQKVAAYLLERREGVGSPEAIASETEKLRKLITDWLASKGATGTAPTGTYDAVDKSRATFAIEEAADGERTWWLVRLEEVTDTGRRFVAAVSVTNTGDRVAVYATLEAGSDATLISPVQIDPRCPKVIRTLIELPVTWHHGNSELHGLRRVQGYAQGERLATEIADPKRTVPFIVVTQEEGGLVLPDLDERLAYDLAGIANIVALDADATWALTDHLGKSLSCYWGAVRLYWPKLKIGDEEDPYRHPRWTAQRLRSAGGPLIETRERFRRQLRGLVMRAAALSVVRPPEIDKIRGASSRRVFTEMKERARSLEDFKDLANSYAGDNDQLRAKNADLHQQVERLQSRIADLEQEQAALVVRAKNAEENVEAMSRYEPEPEEIPPDPGSDAGETESEPASNVGETESAPASGETRFYKKVDNAPTRDVMVRRGDCGHNSWEAAHAADKAKKGVAKLEDGRNDWKSFQHCPSCTGGGMWRVRW
jgi:hypothetical protein